MDFCKRLIMIIAAIMVITSGCSNTAIVYSPEQNIEEVQENIPSENQEDNQGIKEDIESLKHENIKDEEKEEGIEEEIDLQAVKPNEAGQIMVLMYHHISEPEAEWSRTPDNFRKDLEYLYENGYRPISLVDYVEGNITTEAGYTPVVLTFDDGRQNNFNMIKDSNGEWIIDPDCAVGILEEFHRKHPDFPLEATFFVNDNIPFGQAEHLEYKFKYIIDRGMDIGNHTATHINLKNADGEIIQRELAGVVKMVNQYIPDYKINTLALPFGSRPKDNSLSHYLNEGSYEDISYKNVAILNVGWDPYKSPYHVDFNPLAIHRVRASDLEEYTQGVGMYDWLKRFDEGKRTRFISDGNPDIVTVPRNFEEVIDKQKLKGKELRIYDLAE